mgnify:CR=1 FL=1
MSRTTVLILTALLAACDGGPANTAETHSKAGKQQITYLGSGIELQLGEGETATVFGYEDCPGGDRAQWLFGPSVLKNGCTKLTGRKTVNVRIIMPDGVVVKEKWYVAGGIEHIGTGVQLTRQNGWLVREPIHG